MTTKNPLQMTQEQSQRLSKSYAERVKSFLEDGYRLRHETVVGPITVCRLHHMSNGNDIILHLDLAKGELRQKTNHILTHTEIV